MFTGNRGILPFSNGRLATSRWTHQHWIICTLTHPRGKYHGPMPVRSWTPLFFLDEAVGLAAGHRPCAYCRPDAYRAYKSAWSRAVGRECGHADMDRALHKARVTRSRQQVRSKDHACYLPDGTMTLIDGVPHLIWKDRALAYSPKGYITEKSIPNSTLTVLTPAPTIAVLRQGFSPKLHPSVGQCS
ncbi:hypothetical protein [Aliiroseovarius sp. 2305UL8-7]|uniref:hypothetical protein n=1 Tax=Aliiroseovarius conchicola TaxID=3121637 RepID=UPI00352906BD